MVIGGHPVTVDTTRFKVGPDEPVVRMYYDGRIDIGTVLIENAANWRGARGAREPFRAAGPNAMHGCTQEADAVQILGAVISK